MWGWILLAIVIAAAVFLTTYKVEDDFTCYQIGITLLKLVRMPERQSMQADPPSTSHLKMGTSPSSESWRSPGRSTGGRGKCSSWEPAP